jgi:hypothetical protein
MNEVQADADAEQRRTAAKCMPYVPDNMNIKEGYNFMTILYKIGILSDYLSALDATADNNGCYEKNCDAVEFSRFFSFYYDGHTSNRQDHICMSLQGKFI